MKVRSGFVSNSSSSSFICAVPYIKSISGDERVNIGSFKDGLSDALKSNDNEDINYYRKLIDEYEKISKEYNLYIFELKIDYGDEDVIEQLKKVPGFTVLKVFD